MKKRRYRQQPTLIMRKPIEVEEPKNTVKASGTATFIIWLIGLIISLLFFLSGCKTTQHNKEHTTSLNEKRTDSISRIEKTNAKLLIIPPSAVSLNLNFKNLSDLPIGAKYTEKQGQATVSVEKTGENDFKITANCDSLTRLIVERETEIFHLQNQVRELEEATHEEKVEIINETTPVRWFWIYSGRLFWSLLGIGLIYWLWKKKLPF